MFYAENLSARKCSGSDMLQIYPWIGSLNLFSDGNACSTPPPLLSFCLPAGFNLSQTQTCGSIDNFLILIDFLDPIFTLREAAQEYGVFLNGQASLSNS